MPSEQLGMTDLLEIACGIVNENYTPTAILIMPRFDNPEEMKELHKIIGVYGLTDFSKGSNRESSTMDNCP